MLKDIHYSLRIDLSSVALSLYTARIFTSNWSSIFNCYFHSFCKTLSYCFNNIVYIFCKWLFTIFRKYWYLMNDKDRDSHMLMKIKIKMLTFFLFILCSCWFMNLVRAQTLYTLILFLTMRIDLLKVIIL